MQFLLKVFFRPPTLGHMISSQALEVHKHKAPPPGTLLFYVLQAPATEGVQAPAIKG